VRLDFNVLWVDDQPSAVRAQSTRIKNRMLEEGFNFNPTPCKTIDEVKSQIAEEVFRDEVDLILVDWDLGGEVRGQDVIESIREVAPYKDVVFYSARTPVTQLRRKAFDRELEGIFCASREDLVEEVLGFFESFVKKVLDLDQTRGIVMGATSDIDHMIQLCLLHIEAQRDNNGKMEILKQALKRVKDRVKDFTKDGNKLEKATSIELILQKHHMFTAYDRLRLLHSLLEKDEIHSPSAQKINDYIQKVLPDRNILGHMVLAPEGKPQADMTSIGKKVHPQDMRSLRKMLLDFRELFRSLADALKS
jgi:hypothetical protein